jgi:peptide/nickel transport system substrate-binding protein
MKRSKRIIAVILSFVMCLTLLAACGSSGSSSNNGGGGGAGNTGGGAASFGSGGTTVMPDVVAAPEGANFADHIDVIVNDTQLTVVNPMSPAGTGGPSSWSYILVHDRLVTQPATDVFEPQLATDWYTDDYVHFTFHLRNDVYFHNGDHFTADDVIWTANYAKNDPSAPAHARWRVIDSMNAVDPYTLEIVLSQVYVDFYNDISKNGSGILSKRAHDEKPDDPSWGHIGTGPFKVVDFSSNNYCTFERNENYWGEMPKTRSLTLWTIPEMSTRMVMMKNKEAQVSFQMTPEDLDLIESDPDFQILPVMINEPVIIGYNDQGDAVIKDINFRKAVAHALDFDDLAMVALGRWATAPWDGNVWGPDTQYRLKDLPKWEQDIDLAKEYLAKSVYNGEVIELQTTSAQNIRAAELLQLQLEQVGIKVDILPSDHAGFVDAHRFDPESKRQMHLFSMAMSPNVSGVLNSLTSKATNRLNCNDPYVYEFADAYRGTTDVEARRAMVYEFQEKYFYESLAAMVVYWRVQGISAVNGVGGIKLSSDQFEHNLRGIFWNIDETPANLRP